MKYLGVDYGKKKIGLAVSEGMIASSFKVIEVSGLKDAVARVRHITDTQKIDKVILGLPESGDARKITEMFGEELKKNIALMYFDETLSSKNARSLMIEMGTSKKNRAKEDAVSASIILQYFLDELNK